MDVEVDQDLLTKWRLDRDEFIAAQMSFQEAMRHATGMFSEFAEAKRAAYVKKLEEWDSKEVSNLSSKLDDLSDVFAVLSREAKRYGVAIARLNETTGEVKDACNDRRD